MSGQVTFLFGIHNHQPIGNFDEVFEEAYRKSYDPFLKVMEKHPSIRWSLHCTGILWDWLEKRHPDYLKGVGAMAAKGQVEILSGGFYEPILPVIPDADKIGQIRMLNRYVKNHFGTEPKGMWCAERVWEPNLPKYIRAAGIEYTVLDDTHFMYSGLSSEELAGYYRVEDEESVVDIFPISQELRYSIPFKDPEETIRIFKKYSEKFSGRDIALTMADDGEKFGMWPETYKLIYEKNWLDRFLTLIEQNSFWLRTDTFSGYRADHPALGKVYLPTASYFEMSEWSLPTGAGIRFESLVERQSKSPDWENERPFTKGGFWRNFLAKYPEADSMYKKMLYVSKKVHAQNGIAKDEPGEALSELWAGQCNCTYWHGAFGGLYLPFLRQAVYQKLISAEKILDTPPSARAFDFDRDGKDEIIIEARTQNVYISPARGGAVFEWDFKPAGVNIANVLTRRPEIYHDKLKRHAQHSPAGNDAGETASIHDLVRAKEPGLENILQYDWYRRANLIDHFLHPATDLQSFKRSQYGEQGDFVTGIYSHELADEKGIFRVRLARTGTVWTGDQSFAIEVEKTVELKAADPEDRAELRVRYRIRNLSGRDVPELRFAPELNFSFSVPEPDQEFRQALSWEKQDPYLHWTIRAEFSDPADLWILPLETVSNSESGFEKTFQGLVALPQWRFALPPQGSAERSLIFRLARS